ncbi:MAG TPA: hypothetical protein VMU65_10595, partial [Candidatus Saccharimonadales bacterium]|nr:hypothetical protein [Candidatus Saccharimonadales bacterium]
QRIPFRFSIDQVGVGPLFRLVKGSPAKDFDERGRFHDRIRKALLHPDLSPSVLSRSLWTSVSRNLHSSVNFILHRQAARGRPARGARAEEQRGL